MSNNLLLILQNICRKHNYTTYNNASGITLDKLLEQLVYAYDKKIKPSDHLYSFFKIAKGTLTRFYKGTFPDRDGVKNKDIIRWLLDKEKLRICPGCFEILSYTEYCKNKDDTFGISSYCRSCQSVYRKDYYSRNKGEEIHNNSLRKADISDRVYPWSDLEGIKEFYINRPPGCHVDHIIPLHGTLVSGLHVLSNLQYLSIEENLSKGNKYTP